MYAVKTLYNRVLMVHRKANDAVDCVNKIYAYTYDNFKIYTNMSKMQCELCNI